jgi:nucleoside 2-deoxyribosyltransferase
LFDEGERWWIERVEQTVAAAGLSTFLPHRDNPPKDEYNVADIFANDRRGIDQCDVVIASLNGITTRSLSASRSSACTPTGVADSITR